MHCTGKWVQERETYSRLNSINKAQEHQPDKKKKNKIKPENEGTFLYFVWEWKTCAVI